MITFRTKGDLSKTQRWMIKARMALKYGNINALAQKGVNALSSATPVDTGKTAASWEYNVEINSGHMAIRFYNTNYSKWDTPIVIYLMYGHATRNGGWVPPNDFVTPVLRPLFEEIAKDMWEEVVSVR